MQFYDTKGKRIAVTLPGDDSPVMFFMNADRFCEAMKKIGGPVFDPEEVYRCCIYRRDRHDVDINGWRFEFIVIDNTKDDSESIVLSQEHLEIESIFTAFCRRHDLSPGAIRSTSRKSEYVRARAAFAWIVHNEHGYTKSAIARFLKRDHTTIIHAINSHEIVRRRAQRRSPPRGAFPPPSDST